jgi:hypothetical protein
MECKWGVCITLKEQGTVPLPETKPTLDTLCNITW